MQHGNIANQKTIQCIAIRAKATIVGIFGQKINELLNNKIHKYMKISGINYKITTRETILLETALNDCINIKIVPNEGFEGLLASHEWLGDDYIFASIYLNPKNGMWDLYEVINNFDDEKKISSSRDHFQAINQLKKLQDEIWGDAYRNPVIDTSEGVMLRQTN